MEYEEEEEDVGFVNSELEKLVKKYEENWPNSPFDLNDNGNGNEQNILQDKTFFISLVEKCWSPYFGLYNFFKRIFVGESYISLIFHYNNLLNRFPNNVTIKEKLEIYELWQSKQRLTKKDLSVFQRAVYSMTEFVFGWKKKLNQNCTCFLKLVQIAKLIQNLLTHFHSLVDDFDFFLLPEIQNIYQHSLVHLNSLNNILSKELSNLQKSLKLNEELFKYNYLPNEENPPNELSSKNIESFMNFGEKIIWKIAQFMNQILNSLLSSPDIIEVYLVKIGSNELNNIYLELSTSLTFYNDWKIEFTNKLEEELLIEKLNPPVNIGTRFSKEFRLLENTRATLNLTQEIGHLCSNFQEILTELILKNKTNKDIESKEEKERILELKEDFEEKIICFSHILTLQKNLLDSTFSSYNKNERSPLAYKIRNSNLIKENVRKSQESQNNNSDENELILSYGNNEEVNEDCKILVKDKLLINPVLDEFYELNLPFEKEVINSEDEEDIFENEKGLKSEKETQMVIMDQLKERLKSRRNEMLTREKEAYRRAYGKDLEVEEFQKDNLIKELTSSNKNSDEESESEEENVFKNLPNNFILDLQEVLKKKGNFLLEETLSDSSDKD